MSPRRVPRLLAAITLAGALAGPRAARGWEAGTTHAGLTESAALGSGVHGTLTAAHGRELGWYEPLTVPKEGAPQLHEKLAHLEPSEGYVPDARGRQSALGWLVAGSVLEDVPASRGRHHFYDPVHKTGLTGKSVRGLRAFVDRELYARLVNEQLASGGTAAPDWIMAPANDLGMTRFWKELEASATAASQAERDRHLAYALLCAGAMMHVLADVGSPSRARDDLAAHLSELGAGPGDRGSRFERLAALAFGRLGIDAVQPIARASARDFFTSADGQGLADLTAARWFSSGTLPASVPVARRSRPADLRTTLIRLLRFKSPTISRDLDLATAGRGDGAVLRDEAGVCLASYRVSGGRLAWAIPDDCAAEQIAVILPTVAAYTGGLLEYLFRGTLAVDADGVVAVGATALGKGTLTVYGEAADGTRKAIQAYTVAGGAPGDELASPDAPEGSVRLIAVFSGVDSGGEALIAVGTGAR